MNPIATDPDRILDMHLDLLARAASQHERTDREHGPHSPATYAARVTEKAHLRACTQALDGSDRKGAPR